MVVSHGARVGVLCGGWSSEREVSLRSGQAVYDALVQRGWDVVSIDVGRDLAEVLASEPIDVAWLALHGRHGEDGCVQGLLEVRGTPYTGSGVLASAVAMDKHRTKVMLGGVPGVTLAPHRIVTPQHPPPTARELPVVIKPAVGGSTVGLTVVRDVDAWPAAVARAGAEHPLVMEEAWIPGLEITCAVLDGEAFPLVAIQPEGGLYDYEAKYHATSTRYVCPAPVEASVAQQAQQAATAAYEALGCRGLARVDFLVPQEGGPVMLEVNTLPGMTARSLGPMAAAAAGLGFDELVERILRGARCDP